MAVFSFTPLFPLSDAYRNEARADKGYIRKNESTAYGFANLIIIDFQSDCDFAVLGVFGYDDEPNEEGVYIYIVRGSGQRTYSDTFFGCALCYTNTAGMAVLGDVGWVNSNYTGRSFCTGAAFF